MRLLLTLLLMTGCGGQFASNALARSVTGAVTPSHPPPAIQPFIVVIDAGHGGKDGGTQGSRGTLEKDVVLSIAHRLAVLIQHEDGIRSVMIRDDDQFVELQRRADIAQSAKADLFISLHADAYENDAAEGISVFTLSETGASSEAARCLADRENAGQVAGVDLKSQDPLLASVLVDLSKNATLEASDQAASRMLKAFQKEFRLHNATIQKAGFAVLKSLDVPSMLIETAFLSNPAEELKLLDPRHQDRIAHAILGGIKAYAGELGRLPNNLRPARRAEF